MSKAPYNTVVNFYNSGGFGIVGALVGSEPARFVTADRILTQWPTFPIAEAYVTCDGLVGPFDVPFALPAPGFVEMKYVAAVILEDALNPGVFFQLMQRQNVVFPLFSYVRYQINHWPYP